jgi:inhibitor of cysteine peptidase
MRKLATPLAVASVLWLWMGAGALKPDARAEEGPKMAGDALLHPRIEVEAGEEFSIALASNRTTGYRWQLVTPLDEQIVKPVGSEYVAPAASRPGAGGEEVWTFRAVGPGKTEIALQYVRPWETGVAPAETARYVVVVR